MMETRADKIHKRIFPFHSRSAYIKNIVVRVEKKKTKKTIYESNVSFDCACQ